MSGTPPAGYSGKPVWQKLGLAPGAALRLVDAPADYAALVGLDATDGTFAGPGEAFTIAHVFVREAAVLARHLRALDAELPDTGMLWVSWPKRSARVPTDVTEDTIRSLALPLGLVDVKVCAVDATWSGLKLVRRREHRR